MLVDPWIGWRYLYKGLPVSRPTFVAKSGFGCPMWFDLLSRWKLPELVLFPSPSEAPAFPTAFPAKLQLPWETCQGQMVCLLISSIPRPSGLWDLRYQGQLFWAGLTSPCPLLSLSPLPSSVPIHNAIHFLTLSPLSQPLPRGSFLEPWSS